MKNIYISILILTGLILVAGADKAAAQIKIGTNGSNISPASLLELESANQGLLIPRMANTVAIDALNPPVGMVIFITTEPSGLYVKKTIGWEYLTGFLSGNAFFNSVTVTGAVTAGSFSGPLTGNATTATTALNSTNSANSAVTNDISSPGVTYPVFVNSTPGNQPLRTSSGNLSYVPATGILTARGFVGPLTGDVTGNATSAVDAQNTVNVRITDDVINPAVMYPTFVTGNSGPLPARVASTKLSFVPLTGDLTATTFRGALVGNASSATTVTGNVAAVNGGTGQSIYSPGDMLYANTSTSLVKLPIGTPGTVLRVSSGNIPSWSTAGAGTVINVTGTPNRITVTDPTVSPVLDIASTYAGQPSITTVGIIATGTWNGKEIDVAHGGTGRVTLPLGRVLIGNGTGAVADVDGDVPNLVLTSNGPGLAPTFKSPGAGDMVLNVDQTVTGIKTFGVPGNVGKLVLAGNTSGATTLNGPSAGIGGTVVLPLTGTLSTLAGTETLSNKTLTSPTLTNPSIGAATGTTLVLGGGSPLGTTNQTGTGRIVMDNNPVLITPNIGVASGTSLDLGGGTVTAAQFTGNASTVTSVGGLSAGLVANGASAANAAVSTNTGGRIVIRDPSGNFAGNVITAVTFSGNATSATSALSSNQATNADNIGITNDLTTAADLFPTFVNVNSGYRAARVSDSRFFFRPSTGLLTATNMSAGTFTSTATGVAPFIVTSNIAVANLQSATAAALNATHSIFGSDFNGTQDLTGPIPGQFGGTGVANNGRTITLATNLATTGAGLITLNSIAGSTVTLPASGVLYGTAGNSIPSADLDFSVSDDTGTGNLVFANDPNLVGPKATSLIGNGSTPTFTVGAGITLVSITGNDLAGTITLTSDGSVASGGIILTVDYAGPDFPNGSYPVLFPGNANSAGLLPANQIFAVGSAGTFVVRAGGATLPGPAQQYIWNYHVIGR